MRLKGKVAVITGATGGIGRAAAVRFANEGARVVVSGRNKTAGDEVVAEIDAAGGTAAFVASDIAEEAQVEHLFEETTRIFGGLDVLVNNASATDMTRSKDKVDGTLEELTTERWTAVLGPALHGFFWCSKYGAAAIAKTGRGGSVVNMSSAASMRGYPGADAYAAAKGAMNSLTRATAVELAGYRIRVNAIIVGFVPTSDVARSWANDPVLGPKLLDRQLTPLGRPEDIANVALFLASDESVFVTGTLVYADGGASIMPSFRPHSLIRPDADQT